MGAMLCITVELGIGTATFDTQDIGVCFHLRGVFTQKGLQLCCFIKEMAGRTSPTV